MSARFSRTALAHALLAGLAPAVLSLPVAAEDYTRFEAGELEGRVTGRIQYDALIDSDAPDPQQDSGELRRLRLGVFGRYTDDWRYGVSVDFADDTRLRDLAIEYRGWPVRIEAGRLQEPFGLAEYGSSKDTLFMERPSPSALGPDYGLGATVNYRGSEAWAVSAGAFAASDHQQFGGDRNESSLTGRLTATPLRGDWLLHLGVGASQRRSEEPRGLRASGSAETVLVSGYTPASLRELGVDRYRLLGAEFALRRGPVLLQSEWIDLASDGVTEGSGVYAELGWAITGEKRDYSVRYGNFDGIEPRRPLTRGGWGAFEVGLRLSRTDFSDGGGSEGQVAGLAFNWYPVEQIRFSVNAQRVTLEVPGQPEIETDVIQGRVQAYF